MDATELYRFMEDASLLNKDTLPGLKQLVDDYPYFQTARMLYLKNLAMLNDIQFGVELNKTAIYIPDRKMLYMFIEDVRLILKKHTVQEPLPEEQNPFDLIDTFLKDQLGEEPDPTIVLPPSVNQDYVLWSIREGQSLEDGNLSPALKHEDLINKYLEDEEQGGRRWMDTDDTTQYATPDSIGKLNQNEEEGGKSLDDSYFTETLARVYIRQKRYAKALEIIRNLSLKYPEKNIYFADQIRFLEKLIINTKKNS
ncbi:MAG: hypothetical protein LBB84_12360 [Tannerellaceae bacterium]|jgi:hypothetical protein|nr:hypothetical protein [Tannerellaceae bacterium]